MNPRVVVFQEYGNVGAKTAAGVLRKAGYHVYHATDQVSFRELLPTAHCGVPFAYEVTQNLLPNPLDGTALPSLVVMSPRSPEDVVCQLQDLDVVYSVLKPTSPHEQLVRTVTMAVVSNIVQRIEAGVAHESRLSDTIRSAIRAMMTGKCRTVKSLSVTTGVPLRTLEAHWSGTFGPSSPKLKDLCRSAWLLQFIRAAADQRRTTSRHIYSRFGISRSTFRRTVDAFAGERFRESDLVDDPARLIARVCARGVPPRLRSYALFD